MTTTFAHQKLDESKMPGKTYSRMCHPAYKNEISDNAMAVYYGQPSQMHSLYDRTFFYSVFDTNAMMIYPLFPICDESNKIHVLG
jgi:hypothetical protein